MTEENRTIDEHLAAEARGKGGAGNGSRAQLRVIPMPQKRELHPKHLEQLRASGLSDETIELAELYTEGNFKVLAELMNRRIWPRTCGAALVFPFFEPGIADPIAYRVRPTTPRVDNRRRKHRTVKYDQAEDAGVLVYLPPRARKHDWYASRSQPLYWTEGEKKALLLDQLGLCAIGLTGVYNFGDVRHKDQTGEERFHPIIRQHVIVDGRAHVIVFDADAAKNEDVMRAAQRLSGLLQHYGAGSVRFVTPPSTDHKGIDDHYHAFGEVATRELLSTATEIEGIDPKEPHTKARAFKALRHAPVDEDVCVPPDYDVRKDGSLWKVGDAKNGDQKVASSTMLVQRYLSDQYTGEGRADVCFERDGAWHSTCVTLRALCDARTMVAELSSIGAPVTSNSAGKLVDWFDDLGRANSGRLVTVPSVSRAGWHRIGAGGHPSSGSNGHDPGKSNGASVAQATRVFVLNEPVFAADETKLLALDTRGDRRKIFGAMRPRGSYEAHLSALQQAFAADPVCAAMICGALAAPLLLPLSAPNFAVHLPGDSSRGKTSMLKIAGSIYGDPNNEQWVANWNSTAVAAELRAATLCDLPQCYDEVGAGDVQAIERLVYMLIGGGGRSRGSKDLTIRETPSWRTVVLSTGERELAGEETATGAQVRVVQLPVGGFGELGAAEIDALRQGCIDNAGQFGRLYVERLLDVDDWAPFVAAYQRQIAQFRLAARNPLQGRVATYFALLAMAEAIAAQMELGDPTGQTMHRLFAAIDRRQEVRPLAERALDLVSDWVLSESDSFPFLVPDVTGAEEPKGRNGGRPVNGFRKHEGRLLLLIPSQLRGFLDRHKLSTASVTREWAARGWLQTDGGRLGKVVRIGGKPTRVYALVIEREGESLR